MKVSLKKLNSYARVCKRKRKKETELLAVSFQSTFELFSVAMGLPTIKMKMQYRRSRLLTQAKKIKTFMAKTFVHHPNFI